MHVAILWLRKDCIKLLFMLYDESQVSQQRNVLSEFWVTYVFKTCCSMHIFVSLNRTMRMITWVEEWRVYALLLGRPLSYVSFVILYREYTSVTFKLVKARLDKGVKLLFHLNCHFLFRLWKNFQPWSSTCEWLQPKLSFS